MGLLSILSRPSNQSPEVAEVDKWLLSGKQSLVADKGSRAEAYFANILQERPDHPEALQGLMTAWMLSGKSDQVIEYHDESSTHVQEQLREFLWVALAMQVGHLSHEGYAKWICLPVDHLPRLEGLRALAEEFSKCGALTMDWANTALAVYRLDEAQQALKQLRDAQPRLPEREVSRLYARRDAIQLKEHPELAALLNEASGITSPLERFERLEPIAKRWMNIAPLQRETGLALMELKQPQDAMRYLNRAVDVNPYWLNAWIELGYAAIQSKRIVRAKEAFTRAFHLAEKEWIKELVHQLEDLMTAQPHLAAAEMAFDRMEVGDFHGSVEPLQKGIRDQRGLCWTLGEVYCSLGEFAKASSTLRGMWADSLEEGKPLTAEQASLLELATHQHILELLLAQRWDEAVHLLEDMLSTEEPFPLLREDESIAQQLLQGKLTRGALICYERARRKLSSPNPECIRWLQQAIRECPHFPEARLARGILLAKEGDLEGAQADLQQAMEGLRSESQGLFHMAGIFFLQQQEAQAQSMWRQCVERGESPWAERSLLNLQILERQHPGKLLLAWLPTHQRIIDWMPAEDAPSVQADPALPLVSTPPSPPAPLLVPTQEPAFEEGVLLDALPNTEEVPFDPQIEDDSLIPNHPTTPSGDLFEISPSMENSAPEVSPEAVKELAEEALPRFSDLAPDLAKAQEPEDPLAFLSSDQLDAAADDEDLFAIPKETPLPSFLAKDEAPSALAQEEEWSLEKAAEAAKQEEAFALPSDNGEQLFKITDQEELQAEFPLDIAREKAIEDVPTLSSVVEDQQGLNSATPNAPSLLADEPANTPNAAPSKVLDDLFAGMPTSSEGPTPLSFSAPSDALEKATPQFDFGATSEGGLLPDDAPSASPTQTSPLDDLFAPKPPSKAPEEGTLPPPPLSFVTPAPASKAPEAAAEPALPAPPKPPKKSSITDNLFGGDDDLSSFLDEAFMSLDNLEKKN